MKPPWRVWVLLDADGHPWVSRSTKPDGDLWVRYDLHRPKRKARNAALEKVLDDIDRWRESVEPHVEECPVGTRELFYRLLDAVRPPKRKRSITPGDIERLRRVINDPRTKSERAKFDAAMSKARKGARRSR